MSNRLTKGTGIVGDVLLDVGKLEKSIRIRLGSGGTAVGGSETATTFRVPSEARISDAFVDVVTASTGTTKTLSVGLLSTSSGGAAAGFLSGVSVAATGLVQGSVTTATSGGNTGGVLLVSTTIGTLLRTFSSGSTAVGDPGIFVPKEFLTDSVTAKTVSFTPGSTDWIAFSADLYLVFTDVTR